MNLQEYLKDIGSFNLLNKEEEYELFAKIHAGDQAAREKLIVSNLRLVVKIALKYLKTGVPIQDLIQEGNLGLIKSINKFNVAMDRRFSTYATFWIKQSILKYLNDSKNLVRYPSYVSDFINKIYKFTKKHRDINNKFPTLEELSEHLNIKVEEVKKYMNLLNTIYISFEEDAGENLSFHSVIGGGNSVEDSIYENFTNGEIVKMIQNLKGKEKTIILQRYGLFGNERLTLEEIGQNLSLTRERIRQIQNLTISKLKDRAKQIC